KSQDTIFHRGTRLVRPRLPGGGLFVTSGCRSRFVSRLEYKIVNRTEWNRRRLGQPQQMPRIPFVHAQSPDGVLEITRCALQNEFPSLSLPRPVFSTAHTVLLQGGPVSAVRVEIEPKS